MLKNSTINIKSIEKIAKVLGPTNSWLKPGFNVAIPVNVNSSTINILPVSYFLATKFEAFQSRGNKDPYYSHDFEDIVFVLDNNMEIVHDISKNGNDIISFMKELANFILNHPSKNDILSAHMNPFTSEERIPMIIAKLTAIKNLS